MLDQKIDKLLTEAVITLFENDEEEYLKYYKNHPNEPDPMDPKGPTPSPHMPSQHKEPNILDQPELTPNPTVVPEDHHVPTSLLHHIGKQAEDSGLV